MKKNNHNHNYIPINGIWDIDKDKLTYKEKSKDQNLSFGEIISELKLKNASVKCTVTFPEGIKESAGRILFKFSAKSRKYLSCGIGGYKTAYLLDELDPNKGWSAIKTVGDYRNLTDTKYNLNLKFKGNRIQLFVNDVRVIDHTLESHFDGDQIGFFAWGDNEVIFENLYYEIEKPNIFVIMQFGEPFDSFNREVIIPVCDEFGYKAIRADDVNKPGIILQDIIKEIEESDIIIAEITPRNPNVFYELGYAHALKKQIILLAEEGNELPFDIRSYRVILYENSIKGKSQVENSLRKHLQNLNEDLLP